MWTRERGGKQHRILHNKELSDSCQLPRVVTTMKPRGYNGLDMWLGWR
jgi:hypothetical protein